MAIKLLERKIVAWTTTAPVLAKKNLLQKMLTQFICSS